MQNKVWKKVEVNSTSVFAYACGQIPILKNLAKFVAFSPSLSAAVENRYVQPIEQEQTINGITAKIEYVIVDQKQLNIIYSLDSKIYHAMDVTPSITTKDGQLLEGYGIASGHPDTPNGQLNYITIDFIDGAVPGGLCLTFKVHDYEETTMEAFVEENIFSKEVSDEQPEYISEFTFQLDFDPYYTSQGELIELDKRFKLGNQTIILEQAAIYPTHMNLTFNDIESNTAWLVGLDFYIENEKGKKFEKIANGVTATGKKDSPMMASHRLESPFFSDSKELIMYITGVEWLDQDMQSIKLDLKNVYAEQLPQNCLFESAQKKENGWLLTFIGKKYKDNDTHQIWKSDYYDEQDQKYYFNKWFVSEGDRSEKTDTFRVEIPLIEYPYDIVYMSPYSTRREIFTQPIAIKIK